MSSCFFSIMYMMKMQGEETLQCFNRRTDSLKFIVFFLWLITAPEGRAGSVSRRLTVQTGGSLIIPCHYDRKYTDHKKYWCFHAKSAYNYCSILAYANETKGRVSVIDHPDQSFFTVTMRNLQNEDTGAYWCVVEIEGIFERDESEQLYLTVQSAPDVSVVNSSVSGQEGGDISVQCFYSSGYKNKLKQWCRYKDQSCYTVGRTNTSQNSSVQISDDGRGSFTVLMTGLRLTDSDWYYCSAGDLQAPVQLNVSENSQVPFLTVNEPKSESVTTEVSERNGRDATALSSTTPVSVNTDQTVSSEEQQNEHYLYLELLIPAVVLLMVIVIVESAVKLRKKHNRNEYITEVNRVRASDTGNGSSSVLAENDVTYTSVIVQPKTEASSPVSVEDEVTYSSVHKWKPLNT
ncbi:CMRF35-like molecule 1 isoform X12 [Carassius gibelio]|uniref:CMRF35-like molecule 1 isoform X12 n=1 Tax=Carassius gibelio TaxID=101364 RepID=UPI0022779D09|nr:CMRF35-like molecule 1 isoform X12 [Carassius gibelio]